MIRIAICDDEEFWTDKLKKDILERIIHKNSNVQLDCFNSSEHLLKVIIEKKEYIDIVILDIDMPGMSGFDAAKKLRADYPDMLILFCTAHEQYVYESFQFQPFRYIRKEYAGQELYTALTAALQVIESRSDKSIVLKTSDENRMVSISEIMYFETNQRRCDVYLRDGNILNVRKSIKELINEINDDSFVRIHSGAVVNIRYVKSFSDFDVSLDNDKRLIVSRRNIKDVKIAVTKFWGSRL